MWSRGERQCVQWPEGPYRSECNFLTISSENDVADLELNYGHLITAGSHPTPDQHGTGDRVGFFLDDEGTVWGLPMALTSTGAVLACAPPALHDSKVTDTYASGDTIVGSTNEPTGWRGTGKMELLLRGPRGNIQWRTITGARINIRRSLLGSGVTRPISGVVVLSSGLNIRAEVAAVSKVSIIYCTLGKW